MTNLIPRAIADVELQLASAIAVGDTSFTLSSATDDDGNALPAGLYCFTTDSGTSQKEYLIGQLNGVNVTSVKTVTRQGVETSGAARKHRVGAPMIVTNFAVLQRVADILRGSLTLDGASPLSYDTEPTLSNREELATVAYVLDNVTGGTVAFDNQVISGTDAIAGETVAAGDWVFFQTSDQEWYLIDADTAAEVDAAYIGVALGAGTDGVSIAGGIQISGVYTTTGLTAGDIYYLSNTAGEITNSAGTTERAIGVALSTTKLLLNFAEQNLPTADEKAAMTGVNNAPSATNPFVTTDDLSDPTVKPPQIVTFTSASTVLAGASDTRFDVSNPTGTTFRYTFDGTGTDPGITSSNPAVGNHVYIAGTGMAAANQGVFEVTGSGTNYFEVTNASGTVENDKAIGSSGYILRSTQVWTKDAGLKYIIVEAVAGGGGSESSNDSGAGAGGYAKKIILASALNNTEPIFVGVGGIASGGQTGKNTVFGFGDIVCNGGAGTSNTPGAGGSATGGDINVTGGRGTPTDGTGNATGGHSVLAAYGKGGNSNSQGNTGIVIVTEYYS